MKIGAHVRKLPKERQQRLAVHPAPPHIAAHPAFADASTADRDLRPFAAAVKDQGGSGSCEGNAASGWIETTFAAMGQPIGFTPSEVDLYRLGRCIDRAYATPMGQPFPALTDDGCSTGAVMAAIAQWGIRPRRARASDGRNCDVDPETVNKEPQWGDLEEAAHHIVVGEHEISSTKADPAERLTDILTQIRKALNAHLAVRADFFVDMACANWRMSDGPLDAPNMSDPDGGWHAVYIVAVYTDADGKTVLVFRNSWGDEVGDGGDYHASEAWCDAVPEWRAAGVSLKEAT